jgi:hypothetical protein
MSTMINIDMWDDESSYYALHYDTVGTRYSNRSHIQSVVYSEESRVVIF